MRPNRAIFLLVLSVFVISGLSAQAKPNVVVVNSDSYLYQTAAVNPSRQNGKLVAGDPLLVTASQDKRTVLDGMPTLWYEVKNLAGTKGWVPGSQLGFTTGAFPRAAFQNEEQYLAYLRMAARSGEKLVAMRSDERLQKGDTGYFVSIVDGLVVVAWERYIDYGPDEGILPRGFPKALLPYILLVEPSVVELTGEQSVTSLANLAKTLPGRFPETERFHDYEIDEPFPWYIPEEANYGGYDYGYNDYDYYEGEESYGMIDVGSTVILGAHDEVNGGRNWTAEMDKFVGKEAQVVSLEGVDSNDFLVVKVSGNSYVWRVRNLALKGRGEPGSYGYKVGDRVIIDSHRYINGDNNWAEEMWDYVGSGATITELLGPDDSGSYIVTLDVDDGAWVWRAENLYPDY